MDVGFREPNSPSTMTALGTLLPLTTGSSLAVRFSSYGDLSAVIHVGSKVPLPDAGFLEMPARYPTLNAHSMFFERCLSWRLSFPQSCRPVGCGQSALLTLVAGK
jgi:hypothetical protein